MTKREIKTKLQLSFKLVLWAAKVIFLCNFLRTSLGIVSKVLPTSKKNI